jgi:hypothetical protein
VSDDEQQPDEPRELEIILQPDKMAGVWANFARVTHSEHEFTLDFVRMETGSTQGIVVARVSVSPLFITQLIDALGSNWQKYAAKAMPKEVHDADAESEGGGTEAGEDPDG